MHQTYRYSGSDFIRDIELVEPISKTPRYYQGNAMIRVADNLKAGVMRQDVVSPTGTGKTLISKLIALSVEIREALGIPAGKPMRVLFIAHRDFLLRQAEREYEENKLVQIIPHSVRTEIPATLKKRGWDLTIIDESHHEAMMSFQHLLETIGNRPLIGLTADNQRHDKMMLKFERSVYAISETDACEQGFIEKAGVNSIVDTAGTDKTPLLMEVMERYHTHMGNTLIFVRTEREVRSLHRHLRRLGLSADTLLGADSERDLETKVDRLSRGKIQFLINCKKLGEGMDTPAVTDVILARRFESEQEKKQYIGRAIRPDSPCAVWEFVDPMTRGVITADVVGATKYQRLISQIAGQWSEMLFAGEDPTWGQMGDLRLEYSKAYDERYPEEVMHKDRKERAIRQREREIVRRNLGRNGLDVNRMLDQLRRARAA